MDKLKEMLEIQAFQPCTRYDDTECIHTEDCLTEYCWPCYGKVMLQELERHLSNQSGGQEKECGHRNVIVDGHKGASCTDCGEDLSCR